MAFSIAIRNKMKLPSTEKEIGKGIIKRAIGVPKPDTQRPSKLVISAALSSF